MNDTYEKGSETYSFEVRNYLRNKEIFGDKFLEVHGCEEQIEWLELDEIRRWKDVRAKEETR